MFFKNKKKATLLDYELEIISNYELATSFPADVLDDLEESQKRLEPTKLIKNSNYKDLTDIAFVTIDGNDSKDFDDAVYISKTKTGFNLLVAIADVSHYVSENSKLDKQALLRGNSIYLPHSVIPMLPESLSNDLCSLKPKVPRATLICSINFDEHCEVVDYDFFEAVICSQQRLTYSQVNDFLENQALISKNKKVIDNLKLLHEVYHKLNKIRNKRGALTLEIPAVKYTLNKKGFITEISQNYRKIAEMIIEEMMLCANICAADFITKSITNKSEIKALYRVHDKPSVEKLINLKNYLIGFGIKLPQEKINSKTLSKISDAHKNKAHSGLIDMSILRSQQQAKYSSQNIGHFGLSYDTYTHFTSPIRRYSDLIVHRIIKSIINQKDLSMTQADIINCCEHISVTERIAEDVSREVESYLKCKFLENKVGKVFKGSITGVTRFGVFIQLDTVFTDSLLHIKNLKGYYIFDEKSSQLINKSTSKTFAMGDRLEVIIRDVNTSKRKIDVVPTDKKLIKPPKNKTREKIKRKY